MAGFTARMWQGKCYEEQGKLGEAMGIYNELIDHPDPNLRRLQKQVDYFRIIVMAKRKEYALAADECVRWLDMFPKDRRSYEALGVQFELAKNILAQLPEPHRAPIATRPSGRRPTTWPRSSGSSRRSSPRRSRCSRSTGPTPPSAPPTSPS